jgi:hypothetical protein
MNDTFSGVHFLKPIRQLSSLFGLPLGQPTTLNTDHTAVAAVINSGCMTPRCRHINDEKNKDYVIQLVRTNVMFADMDTKPLKRTFLYWFKYWGTNNLVNQCHCLIDDIIRLLLICSSFSEGKVSSCPYRR